MYSIVDWPAQAISYRKKNKEWAKKCVKYLSNNTILNSSLIRKTVAHKKINYDLLTGIIDMHDIISVLHPEGQKSEIPIEKISHYPIINSKIMLLLGEERASQFDYKVVVTNPNAISEIEKAKSEELAKRMQQLVEDQNLSQEEFQQKMQNLDSQIKYEWQDIRELRANCLLNHYWKERNFPELFNDGYVDALTNNEEIYQCCIVSGEPVIRRLNPMKVRVYKSGYSNKIEDADMIVLEDYWSPGRVLDTYYEQLTSKDIKIIEEYQRRFDGGENNQEDPRDWYIWGERANQLRDVAFDDNHGIWMSFVDGVSTTQLPYDIAGNIRVLQCFWKSIKKIKKVKRYDPETGNPTYELFTESYIPDEDAGEEVVNLMVNEAWQGTMIGAGEDAIIVDCRPCQVQYNTVANPSRCHFGIVGTIYNFNDQKPYSLVDMMKPYSYMYDVIKDRLNKLLARNYGKIMQINPTMIPQGWEIPKWLHYIKANGIAFVDPFNEAVKGRPAGQMQMSPVLDLELGNSIQFYINFLEYLKAEIGDISGISRQREGQIQNRETVGGVERATLQSSHTTRWYASKHEDTKKRVLECFLETCKAALKGSNLKFQYILPDGAQAIMEIDGDEFSEHDYGLVVENGFDVQQIQQDVRMIAQAEAQNGQLKFSTYLKLLQNCSIADKIHILESEERKAEEQAQQQAQQAQQAQQQALQAQQEQFMQKMQHEESMNNADNETKLAIATINAESAKKLKEMDIDGDGIVEPDGQEKIRLENEIRQFSEKMQLERERIESAERMNSLNNQTKLDIAVEKNKAQLALSKNRIKK